MPSRNAPETAPQVFISYSHRDADAAFARQLRDRLRSMGYRVWMDEGDIAVGASWDDRIDEGLRSSDAVVGIISPASVASKNVRNEWVFAQEHGIWLKLLLLEPAEIPVQFIRVNYLDFTAQDKGGAFEKLEQDLAATLGGGEPAGSERPRHDNGRVELPAPELVRLQRFEASGVPRRMYVTTETGDLWISDGEQIEAFAHGSPYPEARWLLPNRRWKLLGAELWQDQLVCSDFDGHLYAFGGADHGQNAAVYAARYDDLPIHLITVGRGGRLLVATWDGRIRGWDRNRQPLFPPNKVALPRLPRHLIACGADHFAVADEAQTVWLFDSSGQRLWHWQAEGEVTALWASQHAPGEGELPPLMALLDGDRIVRIRPDGQEPRSLALSSPVKALSHLNGPGSDGWTVLALENKSLAWLSWSTFTLPSAYRFRLDWDVAHVVALHDPQRPSALVCLGISEDRHLFATSDRKVRAYAPTPVRRICPDPSGRFLYGVIGREVLMYRNPALLPVACEVAVDSVEGTLVVGEYRELTINLVNSGSVPISRLSAALRGRDRVLPSGDVALEGEYLPGERIPLRLSVQAIAAGTLQLQLTVSMEDESGPPAVETAVDVHVASQRAGRDGG